MRDNEHTKTINYPEIFPDALFPWDPWNTGREKATNHTDCYFFI